MAIATDVVELEPEVQLERDPDGRYELLDGQLVEKPHMGAKANLLMSELFGMLIVHAKAHQLGLFFTHDCGYQIFADDPKRYRYPDISFVRAGRLPGDKPPSGHMTIVPDLVVEVVSPNNLAEDLNARVADYLGAGVPLIWVIYPVTRNVHIYRPDGRYLRLGVEGELSGEDILPGFSCRLHDPFAVI